MAEESVSTELTEEEASELEAIEADTGALDKVINELRGVSRRKRQFAARVVRLLAERDPELIAPHIDVLIESLERPEAKTRWEVLDALVYLVPNHGKEVGGAYDGAEAALFDEISSTLRYAAFRFLCVWGATSRDRSKKVWPILDEAIQCFHGDLEYRDMLSCLHDFADGKISGDVASELAGRLKFDAENGKGVYLKARSSEIYEMLVKRFKIVEPKRRSRVTVSDDEDEDDSEE